MNIEHDMAATLRAQTHDHEQIVLFEVTSLTPQPHSILFELRSLLDENWAKKEIAGALRANMPYSAHLVVERLNELCTKDRVLCAER